MLNINDIWWPQCCWLDNEHLNSIDLNLSRCSNPAIWEIIGENEPMVHSCNEHLSILLEEGVNTVTLIKRESVIIEYG